MGQNMQRMGGWTKMEKTVICEFCGGEFILLAQEYETVIFGQCPHCGSEDDHAIKEES
jgi:Zn finger protein HypA/HybF involved in hydrogenase expression